jgi:hypothetical protein
VLFRYFTDRIRMHNGAEAEILTEIEDGEWIKVRYLDAEDESSLVGTQGLVSRGKVKALLGAARRGTWGDEVMMDPVGTPWM